MLIRQWKAIFAVMVLCVFSLALTAEQIETSTEGMVSSAQQLASDAGALMLRLGGNAVDAAVATGFALNVVEPHASNLGGEGYMVISLEDGRDIAIDFKSVAPGHISLDFDPKAEENKYGPTAAGIPGVVAGLCFALEEYGTLPLEVVIAPALQYARYGFPLDAVLHGQLGSLYESIDPLTDTVIAPIFFPDGLIPEIGTIIVNEPQARALELIAENGPSVFYRGEIADAMIEATGGFFQSSDLQRYQPVLRDALESEYRGYTVIGAPPIVSGATVAQVLNIMDTFDLSVYSDWSDPEFVHILSQAQQLASADLAFMADSDFYEIPIDVLVSQEYADGRAALIDLESAIAPFTAPKGDPWSVATPVGSVLPAMTTSTTHYSTADKYGNAVATTQTLSSFWGSKVMVPGYGFFLNNEIKNFSAYNPETPTDLNMIAPFKKPLTILSPTVVREADGDLFLVCGTPGGGNIPWTVCEIIINVIDFGMSLEEAILAPKFASPYFYPKLYMEGGYPAETVAALEAIGHVIQQFPPMYAFFGGPNAIIVEDGVMTGVGTYRRDGGSAAP
jgi:gamma-glutamyltranspeptidase/glutathione hydrolase